MGSRIMLTFSIICSLLVSFFSYSNGFAASQPYNVIVTRTLPSSVIPGQSFNVTVAFTAPSDDFNAIGLRDFAPSGWSVEVNNAWNTPNSNLNNITDSKIDYIWYGPFTKGTAFSAVYHVTVPANAAPGTYNFGNPSLTPLLEYYIAGQGPFVDNIGGQNQVNINGSSSTPVLTSSLNPSSYGQSVTFTARVSAAAPAVDIPTGSVTFKDGAVVLSSITLNGSGQAIFITSTLSVGSHSIIAIYNSDANSVSSTSLVLYQNILKRGDVNGNGVVDMGDVVKVDRIILGLDQPTVRADANLDGLINKDEITKIVRIILGLDPL